MDVVRTVLDRLKGTVHVISQSGKGTTIQLRAPLTLASIQTLLFRVGGRLFAVPISSVVEITRISTQEIHRVDQREVLAPAQSGAHAGAPRRTQRNSRRRFAESFEEKLCDRDWRRGKAFWSRRRSTCRRRRARHQGLARRHRRQRPRQRRIDSRRRYRRSDSERSCSFVASIPRSSLGAIA